MEEEYKEIDLKELFFVLLDKIWIILLTMALFILGAVLITKLFMTPMYVSTTSVYVMNRQNNEGVATSADLSAASQLTKEYEAMVTSRYVLEQVIEKLGLNIEVGGGLKKMVSVSKKHGHCRRGYGDWYQHHQLPFCPGNPRPAGKEQL